MKRSDERIGRAARRAAFAGAALEGAARDLEGASGADGNALSGLAELVQDQATRVSSLAEEIEHRRTVPRQAEVDRSSRRRRDRLDERVSPRCCHAGGPVVRGSRAVRVQASA